MVREMRLVRKTKYSLLFKMVGRFMLRNGDVEEVFPVELKFGTYLPSDRQETMTIVQNLLTVHGISLETAVALLVAAGFPIEDAATEVLRIQSRDFDGADTLLNATGDVATVRNYLGLSPLPPGVEPGPPPPPPAPGGPTPPAPPAQ